MTIQIASFVTVRPAPDLNMNDRLSRWEHDSIHAHWRDAAYWWAKQHKVNCRKAIGPVEVWFEWGTKQPGKRRDPHNWYPTIKAILDGFTRASVWEDDDSEHVHTYEPSFTDKIDSMSIKITLSWEDGTITPFRTAPE